MSNANYSSKKVTDNATNNAHIHILILHTQMPFVLVPSFTRPFPIFHVLLPIHFIAFLLTLFILLLRPRFFWTIVLQIFPILPKCTPFIFAPSTNLSGFWFLFCFFVHFPIILFDQSTQSLICLFQYLYLFISLMHLLHCLLVSVVYVICFLLLSYSMFYVFQLYTRYHCMAMIRTRAVNLAVMGFVKLLFDVRLLFAFDLHNLPVWKTVLSAVTIRLIYLVFTGADSGEGHILGGCLISGLGINRLFSWYWILLYLLSTHF